MKFSLEAAFVDGAGEENGEAGDDGFGGADGGQYPAIIHKAENGAENTHNWGAGGADEETEAGRIGEVLQERKFGSGPRAFGRKKFFIRDKLD